MREATRVLILGASLAALAACGAAETTNGAAVSAPPSAPLAVAPTSARPKIVVLGDSLTAGFGLPMEEAYPALLQRKLDEAGRRFDVVNAGVSGDTSAGGLRRLDWALDGDVEVLVVELGANDGLRGLPAAQMKRNLSEIVTRARQRGIMVILTGMEAPPNYGPLYTAEFRRAFRELAGEHDIVFVPFFLEGVAGVPALNNADGIHPNAEGARVIERTIWRVLEPLLGARATETRSLGGRF
jgi:acyl-CoA thioesterase-1